MFKLLFELWTFLEKKRKRQFFFLLLLTIITSFTEVISLSAIFPFIAVITDPDSVFEIQIVGSILKSFGFTDSQDIIIPLAIAFATAALVAGIMRLILLRTSILLSNSTGAELSINVYEKTLYQPYDIHIARSSSEIISGITQKVNAATNVLISIVTVITSLFLFISIMTTLVLIDPTVALLSAAIFAFAYGITAFYTNSRLNKNSIVIANQQTRVVKSLQEGLGAIRDVLLDGTQWVYKKIYSTSIVKLMRSGGSNRFMNQAPRYAMESLGMILIAIFIVVIFRSEGGISRALPLIGVLALGAQRLLPLMQQIYGNWSVVVGSRESLIDVLDLLKQEMPEHIVKVGEHEPLNFHTSIKLKNISFQYKNNHKLVLDSIDIEIKKGTKIGLVGETGAGKSTFLDILMGLLIPTNGSITIDNEEVNPNNVQRLHALVSHVPQNIFLADATIAENIAFGLEEDKIDYDLVQKVADQSLISKFLDERQDGLNLIVGERGIKLSGGQRQRIGIARALYKKAGLVIFDEATSSLDEQTENEVMNTIYNLSDDLTMILVAHRISTLKECDQIYEIKDGRITNIGDYKDLLDKNSLSNKDN